MSFSQGRGLAASVVVIGLSFLLANHLNQDDHPIIPDSLYYTDIFFITIPPLAIAFSAILVSRHGITGNHSVAWILFLSGTVLWYAGDLTYYYNAEYAAENNDSYLMDFFYYIGYFMYFGFMVFYLRPRRKIISKKIILFGALISVAFIVPSLYFLEQKPSNDSETTINLAYPFLDSMIFVPAFVALVLFFRGEVNFLWVTVTLGIMATAVADTLFLVERCLEIYSSSSVANMFYAWQWVLFIFGAYSHVRIFGATKSSLMR